MSNESTLFSKSNTLLEPSICEAISVGGGSAASQQSVGFLDRNSFTVKLITDAGLTLHTVHPSALSSDDELISDRFGFVSICHGPPDKYPLVGPVPVRLWLGLSWSTFYRRHLIRLQRQIR